MPGDLPRIVSVDDRVVEPPELWTSRLPSKFGPRPPSCPRAVPWSLNGRGRRDRCGVRRRLVHDDMRMPFMMLMAASGFPEKTFDVATYDAIRPGCWKQRERLLDMDANHVEASLCFPNTLPRFCIQTFAERADKELALLCVCAYNDWMIDEWCSGEAYTAVSFP